MSTVYRLIASDMDGTLLNAQNQLSEFTKETLLRLAVEYNVIFLFATGRHYRTLGNAERDLKAYFDKGYDTLMQQRCKAINCIDTHKEANGIQDSVEKEMTELSLSSKESNKEQEHQKVKKEHSTMLRNNNVTLLKHPGFFLVTSNGACIHNPAGELIRCHDIPPDAVRALYKRYCIPFSHKKGAHYNATHNDEINNDFYQRIIQKGFRPSSPNNYDFSNQQACVFLTSVYTTDEWYISALIDKPEILRERYGIIPRVLPFDVNDPKNDTRCIFDDFPINGVSELSFRCKRQEVLLEIEKDISEHFGESLSATFSTDYILDVMAVGMSKAKAVEEVIRYVNEHGTYRTENKISNDNKSSNKSHKSCGTKSNFTYLNDDKTSCVNETVSDEVAKNVNSYNAALSVEPEITMQNVLAFGDSMNDADMIASAGRGFIMLNGQLRLKEELPRCEIIQSNVDDGVARKLREIFKMEST